MEQQLDGSQVDVVALHLEVHDHRSEGRSTGPGVWKNDAARRVTEQETVDADLEDGQFGRDLEGEGAAGDEGGFLGKDVLAELVRLAHGRGLSREVQRGQGRAMVREPGSEDEHSHGHKHADGD
jgi:hypothetical protein